MKLLEKHPVRQVVGAAILIASGSLALSGCSVEQTNVCTAISGVGQDTVRPNSYPLGDASYTFLYSGGLFGGGQQTKTGIIEKQGQKYTLIANDLPPFDQIQTPGNFNNQSVAVVLDTPQTGSIGLTTGCVYYEKVNDIPSVLVNLPSK